MEVMIDEEQQIPDAEELEWLETNSFLPEYEEEDDFPVNDENGRDGGHLQVFTSFPHPHESQVVKKRMCSEENSGNHTERISREQSARKKRALDILDQEKDEDLLQYYPPSQKASNVHIASESDHAERISREQSASKKRALDILDQEKDEDWLQYSPPPQKASNVHIASESDRLMSKVPVREKILSRFALEIEGDCLPVTGTCGDRVYAKMQSNTMAEEKLNYIRMEKPKEGLLSEPIGILMEKLDQEALAKVFEEDGNSAYHQVHSEGQTMNEKLWVEKYAPYSFTELLSDEQTNREVLVWLKQWDSCAFGSQVRLTTDDVLSDLRRHSSIAQYQKSYDRRIVFGNSKEAYVSRQNMKAPNADRHSGNSNSVPKSWIKKDTIDHPPEHKVLLLCGPPGLGKTTLAHVAAKHCGYRVVEINASDDRSSSALESKILDAVQMNSVTADSKPKCLVIDEIDGALEGKGAVEVILKMVAADKKSNFEKGNATQQPLSEKFSSKKGKRSASLLRPIICICNDLYAPALRPMRQIAKVHIFAQPTVNRVVNRLKYICKKEGLKANSVALAALAEYTECDIRSCLNTLQFLNKKKEALNILGIASQVVGQKDISRSCIDIWKKVFQRKKSKHEKRLSSKLSGHKDFEDMYSLLSNRGDCDFIMDGIHENFLKLSYIDPVMAKTVKCLDGLGVSDSLHHYVLRTQKMALHAYQPPVMITISRLIALVEKPNIEWPKSLQRCRTMAVERKDFLKLWQSKIAPTISRHLSAECFVEDFISLFLHILVPPTLRPVALHLLSEREKDEVSQLVDTMVSYSITYKNSKAEHLKGPHNHGIVTEAPLLTLEPPIDDFINFKDYQSAHFTLSLAMKQVLLHQVEKQRILHESLGRSLNNTDELGNGGRAPTVPGSDVLSAEERQKANIEKLPDSKTRKTDSSSSATGKAAGAGAPKEYSSSTSFFDRFRQGSGMDAKQKAGGYLQKAATAERDSRPFLFKFNEGFTNAVKRSVKVRELLF